MTYTYHKRKELNDRFRSLFPGLECREDRTGTPFLYIGKLPEESVPLDSPYVLKKILPEIPRAWDSVVPVFVPVRDMSGSGLPCWMVNYANCGEESLECLRRLMAGRDIRYIPSLKIKKRTKMNDFNRIALRGCLTLIVLLFVAALAVYGGYALIFL